MAATLPNQVDLASLRALGAECFGQTGTVADLYRRCSLNAQGIAHAAETLPPGRPDSLRAV